MAKNIKGKIERTKSQEYQLNLPVCTDEEAGSERSGNLPKYTRPAGSRSDSR